MLFFSHLPVQNLATVPCCLQCTMRRTKPCQKFSILSGQWTVALLWIHILFFFISLSLTFGWLGAAGNTNTTHLQLRTSSGFCPSNIRLPTNQNEPTKSREIQSFADRRITRDMPHAVLHAWGRQARPRRTKHQRCCPPKLKPQSARKSKQ